MGTMLAWCPCKRYNYRMNNRDYKENAIGQFYHIYNRGNAKANIFQDEDDYSYFLYKLKQNLFPSEFTKGNNKILPRSTPLPDDSFSLVSYCLMPNHFHLLLRQNKDIAPSKLMLKLCTSYSKYFNKKYDRVGHLFQDQFKQVIIEEDKQLKWLLAYIHQNPKIAELVNDLEKYRWSSYNDYIGTGDSRLCDLSIVMEQFKDKNDFKKFVESSYGLIRNRKIEEKIEQEFLMD